LSPPPSDFCIAFAPVRNGCAATAQKLRVAPIVPGRWWYANPMLFEDCDPAAPWYPNCSSSDAAETATSQPMERTR